MEPILGQIIMFAGNFAPLGWALCDGQLLPIDQHQALFAILGTTYGGDGRTTFGLPDLRGRAPVHQGAAPGMSPVRLGDKGGSNSTAEAASGEGVHALTDRSPYQAVNFTIALQGVFPQRN